MNDRAFDFHSHPLTHFCFMVSDALRGNPARPRTEGGAGIGEDPRAEPSRTGRQPVARSRAGEAGAGADDADRASRQAARAERPGLLDRLDAWFWRRRQQEIEAYLAQSRDRADLENRLRALDHGIGVRYY